MTSRIGNGKITVDERATSARSRTEARPVADRQISDQVADTGMATCKDVAASSRKWRIRHCAASAAPAFRPDASGRIVRAEPAPRLMAVNIDEGEPGTFKDRHYLERDPHRFSKGC